MTEIKFKRTKGFYRSIYLNANRLDKIEKLCEYRKTNLNDFIMQLIEEEYEFLVNASEIKPI